MAASATLALNTGVWFRRCRLLIVSPVRGHHRRFQAETPLIVLCRFANPALNAMLIYTQMPGAQFVCTARKWRNYPREIKINSRAILILQPMAPILFVFDL